MIKIKKFKVGDIVTNPKVGTFSMVTEGTKGIDGFFKAKIIQGKPLRVSDNARESELNSYYFRKAKNKELKEHESRFSF